MDADRNLLFAIFALQHGLAKKDDVVAAMQAWTSAKDRPLADLLVERGAVKPAHRALLEPLIDAHVAEHGSPRQSLAAIEPGSSVAAALASLRRIDDPDVRQSLSAATVDHPSAGELDVKLPAGAGGLRYRILRPHAKGGLGEVFVAEDLELHRNVALKEIQARHADNSGSRGRFVLEAEITGGLEHPGIVPVYGLGAYADGRPFYAMRFIQGDDLRAAVERFHGRAAGSGGSDEPTQAVADLPPPRPRSAADFATLEFRQLLRRFVDVCNAIAYAHSRGVLHRDLKPGNIMLGKFGETLVVDWGLAKVVGSAEAGGEGALQLSSGSGRSETQAGVAVGTPAYMSPEQAAGKIDELGPATDIYALGATLYAVLAGRPPLDGTLAEVLAKVRVGDIPPPRAINPAAPAALDAVCRKAMAVAPADRYASALALAADIDAWLADEPVAAWREPLAARAKRWARKRPRLVAGTAATLLVGLLAAVVGAAVVGRKNAELAVLAETLRGSNAELTLARDRADANAAAATAAAERAEEERKDTEAFGAFLTERVLAAARPAGRQNGLGIDIKLSEALAAAEGHVAADFARRPKAEAAVRHALGVTWRNIAPDNHAKAQGHLLRAWELRQAHLGPTHRDSLDTQNSLAVLLRERGDFSASLALYEAALRVREVTAGPDHPDTLLSRRNYAVALEAVGKLREALPYYESAMKASEATLGPNHPDTLTCRDDYGSALESAGKLEQALPLLESTLKAREATLGPDHPDTLISRNHYAVALQSLGELGPALELFAATLKTREATLGPDHLGTLASRVHYASALQAAGKVDQALPLLRSVLEAYEGTLGPTHPETLSVRNYLALALSAAGQREKALPLFEATLRGRAAKLGPEHPSTLRSLVHYANALLSAGKPEEALPLYESALKGLAANLGPDHPDVLRLRSNYAMALQGANKPEQALPVFEAALQEAEAQFGPGHPTTLTLRGNYALALEAVGKLEQALPLHEATLRACEAKLGPGHANTLIARSNFAAALLGAGKLDQAVPEFRRAAEGVVALQFRHPYADRIVPNFVIALEKSKQLAEAAVWQRRWVEHLRGQGQLAQAASELAALGDNLLSQQKPAEAASIFRDALALRESLAAAKPPQASPWQVANAKSWLGHSLSLQRQFADATPLLHAGYDGLTADAAAIPERFRPKLLADAAERLAKHYAAAGDAAKAKEWQAKADAHRKPAGK